MPEVSGESPPTAEFKSLGPLEEFKDAIKDITDSQMIFEVASVKLSPLKKLLRHLMEFRRTAEKRGEIEKADGIQKEIEGVEAQINSIEDYAKEKAVVDLKEKQKE